MSRVSENSNTAALNYSLARAKSKLENLQLQGSNLKRMVKPSDDPIGNVDLLGLRSRSTDNDQFKRNIGYSQSFLEFTEDAITDLSGILAKAKEIAIAQASDTFSVEVRKNVAKEVQQLKNQALAIANKRFGNKYVFAGYATSQRPFDNDGNYLGDDGKTFVEVSKDFFVPINITGEELFFQVKDHESINDDPLADLPQVKPDQKAEDLEKEQQDKVDRTLASYEPAPSEKVNRRESVFDLLVTLENGLISGSSDAIQGMLEGLDEAYERVVQLRTKIGSIMSSVITSESSIENDKINAEARKSKIQDADIAEVFSDLEKQKNILQATYKSGSQMIQPSLIDFLR